MPSRRAFLATGFTAGLGGLSGCILPVDPVDRIEGLVSEDDATGPPVAGEVRQEQATGWRAGRVWNVSGPRSDATVAWSTDVGREVHHSPVVRDSKVFVSASKSTDGVVRALDASTGNRLWTTGIDRGAASVALTENRLLVNTGYDTLSLSDSDGDVIDSTSTGGSSTIALDDRQAYFADSRAIHAVPQNFERQGWSRDLEDVASGPATDGDRVYVGTYDDELVAYTVDGDLDWRIDVGRDVTGAPTVAGEFVLVGSVDFAIHAIDNATGRPVWRHETGGPVYGSPAVADETVYATSVDGTVRALALEDGRELWRYDAGDGLETGYRAGPIVDGSTVFVGGIGGEITALDAASGEELWTVTVGDTPIAPPTLAEGYVYVGTVSGTVYGIEGVSPS